MADEVTVPLLPCASIDDTLAFYGALGFHTTYRQRRPNPYVVVQWEDLCLHFFEIAGFDPEQSYGSCLVVTPDIEGMHRAFAAGLRAAYGRVPVSGRPRMTRPRARRNADGVTGFSIVDPGGNWVRVVHRGGASSAPPVGRLARALADAVVQADSRGDLRQAVRILDGALARPGAADDPVVHVEALVYRAELALGLDDPATATELLDRAGRVVLTADEARRAASARENAAALAATLG
ncbi:VOC family protein [Micromonospora sp. WMMD708]|uniref:VOC family protein n=1 Tax=Micromonospora sp. WMMD708 TaxID=3403464 RepID=UPI003BF4C5CB